MEKYCGHTQFFSVHRKFFSPSTEKFCKRTNTNFFHFFFRQCLAKVKAPISGSLLQAPFKERTMSAALLLVWLAAIMPELVTEQSGFSTWALKAVIPAVTLVLDGSDPTAQLAACLAMVQAGHEGGGKKPRGFWSIREVRICPTFMQAHSLHECPFKKGHSCMGHAWELLLLSCPSVLYTLFPPLALEGKSFFWILGEASVRGLGQHWKSSP